MRYLREQAKVAGSDVSEIPVSVSAPLGPARAGRFSLGIEPGEIIQNCRAFDNLGVDRIVISPNPRNADEMLPTMEMLAREVLPAFR